MNLHDAQERVKSWHEKQGLPTCKGEVQRTEVEDLDITEFLGELRWVYSVYEDCFNSPCMKRLLLSLGELIEFAEAIEKDDRIETADAIGDRLFALLGDAVTFSIPAEEVFEAVADSNDTKAVFSADDPRGKNNDQYRDPDIASIMELYDGK